MKILIIRTDRGACHPARSSGSAATATAQSGVAGSISVKWSPKVSTRRARPPAATGGDVALAVGVRHPLIGVRVQAHDAGRRRQPRHRVGQPVRFGQLVRSAAHELDRRVPPSRSRAQSASPSTPPWETTPVTATRGRAPGAPSGSPARAAAHTPRCPPALCPMAATRDASTARLASRSIPAATSSKWRASRRRCRTGDTPGSRPRTRARPGQPRGGGRETDRTGRPRTRRATRPRCRAVGRPAARARRTGPGPYRTDE